MKYYLPTTTLNFTCIAASRSIAPAGCYDGWKLGWNSFEPCPPNPCQDCLLVYDKMPTWQANEGLRADYPLLVELDEALLQGAIVAQNNIQSGSGPVKVCVVKHPIFLKAELYRFVFRTEAERQEMLPRLVGVPEFKLYRHDHPSRTSVLVEEISESAGRFDFTAEMCGELEARVSELAVNLDAVKDEFGEVERRMGATLGYRLGRWLSDANGGSVFSPLEPLVEGDAWMEELNPAVKEVLQAAIRLRGKPFPEASVEKVELAAQWGRACLKTTQGAQVQEKFRAHFNVFLMNLQDPLGNPYRISEVKSRLIQSMAAVFYAMDKDADTISNLIKRENIQSPEILLALYGAVRGYTRFPNTLLSREAYIAPKESPKEKTGSKGEEGGRLKDNTRRTEIEGVGLSASMSAFLEGLSTSGATLGTDSHLAAYVIVWAKMHEVDDAEKAGEIVRMFQDDLRKLLMSGKKPKKEPAPKSLVKKLCSAMTVPSKVIKNWGLSKDLAKLLKADLELRYTRKK